MIASILLIVVGLAGGVFGLLADEFYPPLTLRVTWIGFMAGGLSALLFCVSPHSFVAYTCIFCFGFPDFDASRIFLVGMVLAFALMNGALYGLVGFAIGYIISRARARIG